MSIVTETSTLTLSILEFAALQISPPSKKKFTTLSDLASKETQPTVHNVSAQKWKFMDSESPKPITEPTGSFPDAFVAPLSTKSLKRNLRKDRETVRDKLIFLGSQKPALKLVMSQDFFKKTRGKVRSLKKIMKHPRASIPANIVVMHRFLSFLHKILLSPNPIATKETLEKHNQNVKTMKKWEEIIIRGVIMGEDVEEVEKEIDGRESVNNN